MNFKNFVTIIKSPKVWIYILLGVFIMFFTFFTNDNALEIAISGVASIFIGIGVNNFTRVEAQRDELKQIEKKQAAF